MRPLNHDDLLGLRIAGAPALSPDGRSAAFAVSEGFTSGRRAARSHIWLAPTGGGTALPLTGGPQSDHTPRFSPDGRHLAFLSDRAEARGGVHRLYLLDPASGRIEAIPCPPGDVKDYQWSADGQSLAVLLQAPAKASDPIRFEAEPRYWRLWTLRLDGSEARPVTPEGVQVWEFDWSPDGRRFALLTASAPYEWSWYQTKLAVVDAAGGPVSTLHDPGYRQLARPHWSPDGSRIAFLSAAWSDRGSIGGDLWVIPAAGGTAQDLTAGFAGSVTWMEWETGESLLALAYAGFETVLVSIAHGRAPEVRLRGEFAALPRMWPRFSLVGDLIALSREDTARPGDVWVHSALGGWRQLTDLNPQVRSYDLGRADVFTWQSFDGQSIQGLLVLPPGERTGRPLPLIVNPHGGPTSCTHRRFHQGWGQLLAARGFAVFQPNYRGSTGRGLAFSESNLGDMGGGDWRDIMAGTDALGAAGIADPARLGFGGWSYGGFLTAWAVTQTNRFKAAVMGAGIANWLSFHGRSYLQTWDQIYLQADDPYRSEAYRQWSPIYGVDRVQTPTLIVHGEQDGDVPVGQSYEFHRALLERGIETELVVYPREPHGLHEPEHQRDLWTRIAGWFERHLGVPDRTADHAD